MKKGYRRVRPLHGGLEAWIAAGRRFAVYEAVSADKEVL
jgi:3-mercaptopyruvate sulfurtransferase SseA